MIKHLGKAGTDLGPLGALFMTGLHSKNVTVVGQRAIGDDNDETAAFEQSSAFMCF